MITNLSNERVVDANNALINQKQVLILCINTADDARTLNSLANQVEFVGDLWLALGYGYKLDELRMRIKDRANELIRQEREYLSNCRKNCKTYNSTINHIRNLEEIAV